MKTKIIAAIALMIATTGHADVISVTNLYASFNVCVGTQVYAYQEQTSPDGTTHFVRVGTSLGTCADTPYQFDIAQVEAASSN